MCVKDIIAPIIFDGTCNKDIFETYVQEILIKELKPGQIVVIDNINFHKSTKVKTLIESVGCSILFLPTYSPDLNPIEHYWFKIKNEIRKNTSNFEHFFDAVYYALKKSLPYRIKLYLHKNNKLGICKPYLLDIKGSSNLQNILTLARNDKECALINSMNQLVSGLEKYISHKDLERIMQSCYSKEHERYSLLGDSPEE